MQTDLPMEWTVLDKQLREGEPTLGWPGDRRLWLQVGYILAAKTDWYPEVKRVVRRGDVLARRLEVWRHNEDGTERRLGSWNPEDFAIVLRELVAMDPSRPRHEDVLDRIDRANAEAEERARRAYMDFAGEMAEHWASIVHDRTQPRNVFRGMPGTRDRDDLKR